MSSHNKFPQNWCDALSAVFVWGRAGLALGNLGWLLGLCWMLSLEHDKVMTRFGHLGNTGTSVPVLLGTFCAPHVLFWEGLCHE
jgi:hypothetical protein